METNEAPKAANTYARPAPIKCFKCNQSGHWSSDCLLTKAVHLVKRGEEEENKIYCEPDGDEEEEEDDEDDDGGRNYVVRKLMLTHKQEENTQRHWLF